MPYGRQTVRALNAFLDIGRRLGFTAVNLDNRAGYVEYGQGQRLIAVLAHLDVVPAGSDWQTDPYDPVITEDRVIARGAADDKGPLTAALFALKALADEGFRPDTRIRIIAGLDEENGSSCMEHYVRVAEIPSAGFTPDAHFPVINAEKGHIWLDLTVSGGQAADAPLRLVAAQAGLRPNMVPDSCSLTLARPDGKTEEMVIHGRPAHASTPWNGRNAIALAMGDVERRLAAAGTSHPFVTFFNQAIGDSWRGEGLAIAGEDASGPLTLNAGLLALNEREARLTVDIRYPVTWPQDRLLTALQGRAADLGANLEILRWSEPLYYDPDSPLISKLSEVYSRLTGLDAAPVAIGGGTYARTMPNIVAFGLSFPGEQETAHQADEYILKQTLFAGAAIFRQALRRLAE
ncbi:MAG TPA: dipeptidase PepV [Clostridiales bacterium]|nr:dipeptidase PepV [Clostridiales bacterium]